MAQPLWNNARCWSFFSHQSRGGIGRFDGGTISSNCSAKLRETHEPIDLSFFPRIDRAWIRVNEDIDETVLGDFVGGCAWTSSQEQVSRLKETWYRRGEVEDGLTRIDEAKIRWLFEVTFFEWCDEWFISPEMIDLLLFVFVLASFILFLSIFTLVQREFVGSHFSS